MPRKVKVAVIGSGLAGLTAAHLLSTTRPTEDVEFEVHLFEKASVLGMDASSVSLENPYGEKEEWRVDVPMRSFQGGYYPQLIALYKRLGVEIRQADFSYSFSLLSPASNTQNRRITTTMIYNGASGRAGVSMPSVMDARAPGQPAAVRAAAIVFSIGSFLLLMLQVVFHYVRLQILALPFLRLACLPEMSFRVWAEHAVPSGALARWTGLDASWRDFVQQVLVPLFSAVCTASEADVLDHPAEEFLDYVWLTLGTHHYVVVKGVRDVVARLTANISHIHLASPIRALHTDPTDPCLLSIECGRGKLHTGFAHVVFATQASSAVPLLTSYTSMLEPESRRRRAVEQQISCLKAFQYRPTIVINHTDDTLMPDNTCDRRDLNLVRVEKGWDSNTEDEANCVPPSYTMATHVLTSPHSRPLHAPPMYQTTNPIVAPRQEHILSVARLERAVLTLEAKRALRGLYREVSRRWWQCPAEAISGLGSLQGAGRLESKEEGPGIWLCGSYAYNGIPLLEGCVVSARNIVEQGILRSEGVSVKESPW